MFWTTLKWKVLGHGVPGFGTAAFVFANFSFVERVMAAHAPLRPHRRLAYPFAAVAAGSISGEWRADGRLASARAVGRPQRLRRHATRCSTATSASSCSRCRSTSRWSRWLLGRSRMAAVATVAAYLAAGGLRIARPRVLVRAARAHLLALGCARTARRRVALPARPVRARPPARGRDVPGRRLHGRARPPARALRAPVRRVAGGARCAPVRRRAARAAARRWRRSPSLGALAVAATPASSRASIERFDVEPQALSARAPVPRRRDRRDPAGVRARRRRACAACPAAVGCRPRDRGSNRRTLENVPLWDAARAASRRWTTCSRSAATTASRA